MDPQPLIRDIVKNLTDTEMKKIKTESWTMRYRETYALNTLP